MDTTTVLPNQLAGLIAGTITKPECAPPAQVPLRKDRAWENWGRSARCRPELSFYPETVEDLIRIINFAREAGKRVRATGSGHSWSALVPTDDVLVYTKGLNQVTMDLSDESQPRVAVESGATVREVNDVLERHGYALPFNVVLESVRFGGLIATGSHGSGWNHRTLSDLAHSIELVTASGQLRKFEAGVDSDEVMNVVRLDLGMCGLTLPASAPGQAFGASPLQFRQDAEENLRQNRRMEAEQSLDLLCAETVKVLKLVEF